jgi:hypothetical protein
LNGTAPPAPSSPPVPAVAVGVFTIDRHGQVTGLIRPVWGASSSTRPSPAPRR